MNYDTGSFLYYVARLASLAVFGSLARDEYDAKRSEIDLLVVLSVSPGKHSKRAEEFMSAEGSLGDHEMSNRLSPVIRTVAEIEGGFPLMFDMTQEIRIMYDRESVLAKALDELKKRLQRNNAKRIFRSGKWYWNLKPDSRKGEIFEI